MTTGIPFLFRKHERPDSTFVVKRTRYFDYKHYDSSWMDDEALGGLCLVPDVDITEEQFEFDSEAEALKCMKELWAKVEL